MIRPRHFVLLVVAAVTLTPSVARGQSETGARLLGNVGLGRPTRPIDSRSAGMGGIAVALHGSNGSMVNPAALTSIAISGVWVAFSPENRNVDGVVASGDITTAQFPLIRMAIPFGERWVVGAGFGSYLNQDWGVQFIDTLRLSTGDVAFREDRTSEGGISQFRVDVGRRMSGKLAIGVGGIFYFGKTRLEVERAFSSASGLTGYRSTEGIEYEGWGISLGTLWRPIPDMIVGAAGSWGAALDVEADSSGSSKSFDQPLTLDLGASWQLAPDLLVALSAGWANWSAVGDDLETPGASDLWRFAVGSEFRLLGNRTTQLHGRLGGRLQQLPFRLRRGAPWERALTLGLGSRFRGGLGRVDLAVEFGKRGEKDTNDLEENFTRWTFSVSVFAN
ncbi:MAG: hypothetical protein GWN99_17105 [Gemmatimonadetes bacterium]|uniref:Long-chain fatty acid transport protein n=1 Tax=Candidatus Kutchimonas denitrificans TaxID=3056748 RepID=A0AAE5C8K6_9BACT|nr:hypothetical protein [Gemmatimonadota bacterium]NIR74566.1 hypothetical protein [Candidatus Kutchimonas denitrificans]NIS02756.1 hypothetical protein [Gemmatimonadota bacterium]NIT68917.1 hypothetical protein [Gemmatimonadota bacterium]NIU52222.1 hypothetical protein [Gemmatimonadota bacterium]